MAAEAILCLGGAVIAAALVLLLLGRRAFSVTKKIQGQNTCITINAKRNLDQITLVARIDGEEVGFERRRVRKGQSVEFVFPSGGGKSRLSVRPESGRVQEAEV